MNKTWTPEENNLIICSRAEGLTYPQIAELLPDRTLRTVSVQGYKLCGGSVTQAKWTVEDEQQLLDLRALGHNNAEIARFMDRDFMKVKAKASQLIKAGRLERRQPSQTKPKAPYTPAPAKYSVQELLDYVRQYVSSDACPNDIKYQVKKHFGGWTKALKAAGIQGNIGGKMDPNKPTTVYLLDFGAFQKVGLTQQTVKQRFSGAPPYKILDTIVTDLSSAREWEQLLLDAVKPYAIVPAHTWFERNGKTECFSAESTVVQQQSQQLKLEDLI